MASVSRPPAWARRQHPWPNKTTMRQAVLHPRHCLQLKQAAAGTSVMLKMSAFLSVIQREREGEREADQPVAAAAAPLQAFAAAAAER